MAVSSSNAIKRILLYIFVTRLPPAWSFEPRKQFQIGTGRARLNQGVDFIRFAGVLSFPGAKKVNLSSAWRQGPHAAPYAK